MKSHHFEIWWKTNLSTEKHESQNYRYTNTWKDGYFISNTKKNIVFLFFFFERYIYFVLLIDINVCYKYVLQYNY